MLSLNAPFGARCFLTYISPDLQRKATMLSLSAPFGARCFLTEDLNE